MIDSDRTSASAVPTMPLERRDGELFFRQTEIDAAVEAAIQETSGERSTSDVRDSSGHRIIKLPE